MSKEGSTQPALPSPHAVFATCPSLRPPDGARGRPLVRAAADPGCQEEQPRGQLRLGWGGTTAPQDGPRGQLPSARFSSGQPAHLSARPLVSGGRGAGVPRLKAGRERRVRSPACGSPAGPVPIPRAHRQAGRRGGAVAPSAWPSCPVPAWPSTAPGAAGWAAAGRRTLPPPGAGGVR